MIIVKPIVKKVVDNQKEKLELCLNFVTNDKNRRVVGVIVAAFGIGVFISGCIHH